MRVPPNRGRRSIEELDDQMLTILRAWTIPTRVETDDILCIECFALLQERITNRTPNQVEIAPAVGHRNICFSCGISIASHRTHRVSQDCPQRTFLLRWTPAHHVIHLERVCRACWEAATRNIKRQTLHDINRPAVEAVKAENNQNDNAVAVIAEPQPLPLLVTPPQDQHVAAIKVERDPLMPASPAHLLLEVPPLDQCLEAVLPKNADAVIPELPPLPVPVAQPQIHQSPRIRPKINSLKYRRVSASSQQCLFIGCGHTDRRLVPTTIKELLLIRYQIYIPFTARICQYHLYRNHWNRLVAPYSDFTGFQVDDIFGKLEKAAERHLDFRNINTMDPNLCQYWLGYNAQQFQQILNSVPTLYDHFENPSIALSIYLVKLRTGDSNKRLSTLFKMPRSTLERNMNIARNCISEQLGPSHLDLIT